MELNDYRDEAGVFLEQLGAANQDVTTIVGRLKKDFAILMDNFDGRIIDTQKVGHKTYDVIFLLMLLASRFDTDLENEWIMGRQRKRKKYLEETINR
jgi:CTP:phosphocholine cytidylyltransferase-like protein